MTDTTDLGEIVVTGQRRSPGGTYPTRGGGTSGGGGDDGGVQADEVQDNPGEVSPGADPCADSRTALDWNTDAAAAEAVREFERRASERNPPETLNTREWGAPLFQMPDGRVVVGTIMPGEFTFQNPGPSGRASVGIDWGGPAGGLLIGTVHSHNAGSHVPSGSTPTSDDQDSLRYISDIRGQFGADRSQARLYIAALTLGPAGAAQYAKINIYNATNQQQAIAGQEGPEVNPEGMPCP